MIELSPSLLAADLMHLDRDISGMLENGLDLLHLDIMDAHFVPNLSFGPDMCRAIHRQFPAIRMDAHLMMDDPMPFVPVFAKAGARGIIVHQEVLANIPDALNQIKAQGVRCGLSVKPKTKAETLLPYLDMLDMILIMTVEPGFGGQKFMPEQMEKARLLRKAGFAGDIAADGGVNPSNAPALIQAGVNVLVMGTAYFRAEDPAAVARGIKELS